MACLLYTSLGFEQQSNMPILEPVLNYRMILPDDVNPAAFMAVSYTHLDVYKRQVQAMMVVEPVRAEVLPVTMQQAVERTRVLQQEFQEAL